jgi:hypothetical protein
VPFVNSGSIKGQSFVLRSRFPVERIISVEYPPRLHESLERKFWVFQDPAQGRFQIKTVNDNAATFDILQKRLQMFLSIRLMTASKTICRGRQKASLAKASGNIFLVN